MKSSGKRQGMAARRSTLSFQPIQVGQGREVAATAEPDHTTLNNCYNKIYKNYREYFISFVGSFISDDIHSYRDRHSPTMTKILHH